jgi:hypothetical protein
MQDYLKHKFFALKNTKKTWLRRTAGVLLVVGGIFGMLPVLGFWMLPLGLGLLSVDSPWVRRFYRRFFVWWGRRYQSFRASIRGTGNNLNSKPGDSTVPNPGKNNKS